MKHAFYLIILIVSLILLIFGSGCILNARVYDLDLEISKSQILNYEFSSELLKLKFQESLSKNENLSSEVNLLIMESSVLNSNLSTLNKNISINEQLGEYLINGIHFLVYKPMIFLNKNNQDLYELQRAFYFEKSQNCNEAIKIYNRLENVYKENKSDDYAFVLLHLGYCNAILGDMDSSMSNLNTVIQNFSGTHFSDSSQVLLNILKNNEKKKNKKENLSLSKIELAKKYYDLGLYQKSLDEFDQIHFLDSDELFIKARSLEKIGKIQEAIKIYLELTIDSNRSVATKANRRLMLIGHFYNGGDDIKEKAREVSIRLNDKKVYDFIEKSKKHLQASVIFNEEKKTDSQKINENRTSIDVSTKNKLPNNNIVLDEKFKDLNQKYNNKSHILLENSNLQNDSNRKLKNTQVGSINNQKSDVPDCLQFTSTEESKIHKAEKVLLTDGKFVTTFKGVTKATPVEKFSLLESCIINSPFTISIENLGKVSVKKAEISKNYLTLHTDKGTQKVSLQEVLSIIPDSNLENFHYLVVHRKDSNLHFCNYIEILNNSSVNLVSISGVKVSKDSDDLKSIEIGANTQFISISNGSNILIKTQNTIHIKANTFQIIDLNGKNIHILIKDVSKLTAE